MALECQETTGIYLPENSLDFIDNSCKEEVGFNRIVLSSKGKSSTVGSKTVIEGSGKPKRTSKSHSNAGILISGSAKLLPGSEGLPDNCRSITDLPLVLISEILNCLEPKELGIISCVSTSLYRLVSEHHVWKELYRERWGIPVATAPLGLGYLDEKSWKELFVEREFRSKTFMGRYSVDILYGHTEAIRTVFLLSSRKLIFTSGYDSIVRMWDMEEGLLIASSQPLGCTIRAVAADIWLLIAGGTDGFIHGWRAEEGHPQLFNLRGPSNQSTEFRLWEHEGPITCLALDSARIYSGSWDMTIRVWDRALVKCLKVLRHNDWVWSLAPHDMTVASTSGSDVYIWDTSSGTQISVINCVHVGNTYSLARSHTGNLLFTGGEGGLIRMFDLTNHTGGSARQIATWMPHSGPVYSLAFEFPWLVSASSDGMLSLIDVRKLLKTCKHSLLLNRVSHVDQKNMEPPQRMLHGSGCSLFTVDIGSDRVVCGGEDGVVRIWNFSQALEIERRVRALRGIRLEHRMRRRKLQNEMNSKSGRTDRCSFADKKNPTEEDGNRWYHKHRVTGKLKA